MQVQVQAATQPDGIWAVKSHLGGTGKQVDMAAHGELPITAQRGACKAVWPVIGQETPLPAVSSPSELCRQVERVLGQGMAWGCALGLCLDRSAEIGVGGFSTWRLAHW